MNRSHRYPQPVGSGLEEKSRRAYARTRRPWNHPSRLRQRKLRPSVTASSSPYKDADVSVALLRVAFERAVASISQRHLRLEAANVFRKTNPRVSRHAVADKVRAIVHKLEPKATVRKPSREKRLTGQKYELAYTMITVLIPPEQDYNTFSDKLSDLLTQELTKDEFFYLALDVGYQ